MWKHVYHKNYENVSAQAIWDLWANVNAWPAWHHNLEFCKLNGSFAVNSSFVLKPKNMGPVTITITTLTQGVSFTDCTPFFGAKMYDIHELQETPNGLCIKNTIYVTGPLAWVWRKLVAEKVAYSIPEKIDALVTLARKEHE